jgi:Raf kinase inhibitor-like YbhB/YbcL family protein
MLKHIPSTIGRLLKNVRPGLMKLLYYDPAFKYVPEIIQVTSGAFSDGQGLPVKYTADGDKISPPLRWKGVPAEAMTLVLVIEDADSPTPAPLTHAIDTGIPGIDGQMIEGGVTHYLPPDPPPGHGFHRYVFELFAVDKTLDMEKISKKALKEAIRNHVVAKGKITGLYERRKDLSN